MGGSGRRTARLHARESFQLRRLENACRERKGYHCTTGRTIGDLDGTAVCLYHCIDKSQAQAVARRVLALYEPLERSSGYLRRKPRTVIFNHERCRPLLRTQSNLYPALGRKMSQLVLQQITHHASEQRQISA